MIMAIAKTVILLLAFLGLVAMFGVCAADVGTGMPTLSAAEQTTMRRGGCDIDCETTGHTCRERTQYCADHEECEELFLTYMCNDQSGTEHELCMEPTPFGLDCVVDDPYQCSPKKLYTGFCDQLRGICDLQGGSYGDCDTALMQCHY